MAGSPRDPATEEALNDEAVVDWLSNKETISTIMACTEEVMGSLRKYSKKGTQFDSTIPHTIPVNLKSLCSVHYKALMFIWSELWLTR